MYVVSRFTSGLSDHKKLQDSSDDVHRRPICALEAPQGWQPLVTRLAANFVAGAPTRILVCGPKGSGKSTICRLFTNALLTTPWANSQDQVPVACVIVLDLDPGQPEFSAPGEISLTQIRTCNLGVPFTHPGVFPLDGSTVLRSHYIGFTSPRNDPRHYLDCVLDLLECHSRLAASYHDYPLIINCSGWIQGSGLELLTQITKYSNPTDVIYTSLTGPEEVTDALTVTCGKRGCSLHQISSQPYPDAIRSASDLRTMQTLSYFHLAECEAGNLQWDPVPLMTRRPIVVPFSGSHQAILAVIIPGDEHNPAFFPSILDGSLVGMVLIEDDAAISEEQGMSSDTWLEGETRNMDDSSNDGIANSQGGHGSRAMISSPTIPDPTSNSTLHSNYSADVPEYLKHISVCRTPAGIPFLPPIEHVTPLPNPKYTRSIGQALIRSVDINNQAFHLLTPISASELQSLHQQKRKILLIRGNLDSPTWAYKENLEYEKSRRRQRRRQRTKFAGLENPIIDGGKGVGLMDKGEEDVRGNEEIDDEEDDEDEVRNWAKSQPWVTIPQAQRKESAKARRVRRDLRYRGQTDASE